MSKLTSLVESYNKWESEKPQDIKHPLGGRKRAYLQLDKKRIAISEMTLSPNDIEKNMYLSYEEALELLKFLLPLLGESNV